MLVEWETTALPLLRALASTDNQMVRDGYFELGHGSGAAALGVDLDERALHDALLALRDVDYIEIDKIEYAGGSTASIIGARVTGRGMRALGEWPSLEALMTPATLAAIMQELGEFAPDEEARSNLETAASAAASVGRNTAREVIVAFSAEALKAKLGLR